MANTATNKPALPFSVDYQALGGEKHSNSFASATAALRFAVAQAQLQSVHIMFKKWTQKEGWTIDNENAARLADKLQGKGNPQAVSALAQHQELTGVLAKRAQKQPLDNDTVKLWLESVYVSARAMGVTPSALDAARAAVYQGQPQPQKEPARA